LPQAPVPARHHLVAAKVGPALCGWLCRHGDYSSSCFRRAPRTRWSVGRAPRCFSLLATGWCHRLLALTCDSKENSNNEYKTIIYSKTPMGEQASTIRRKGLLLTTQAVTIGHAASRQAPNYWASCKQPGHLQLLGGLQPAPHSRNRAPGCHPDNLTRLHSSRVAATQGASRLLLIISTPTLNFKALKLPLYRGEGAWLQARQASL